MIQSSGFSCRRWRVSKPIASSAISSTREGIPEILICIFGLNAHFSIFSSVFCSFWPVIVILSSQYGFLRAGELETLCPGGAARLSLLGGNVGNKWWWIVVAWVGLEKSLLRLLPLPPASYSIRDSHPYLKLEGKFKSVCHNLHANILVVWKNDELVCAGSKWSEWYLSQHVHSAVICVMYGSCVALCLHIVVCLTTHSLLVWIMSHGLLDCERHNFF